MDHAELEKAQRNTWFSVYQQSKVLQQQYSGWCLGLMPGYGDPYWDFWKEMSFQRKQGPASLLQGTKRQLRLPCIAGLARDWRKQVELVEAELSSKQLGRDYTFFLVLLCQSTRAIWPHLPLMILAEMSYIKRQLRSQGRTMASNNLVSWLEGGD